MENDIMEDKKKSLLLFFGLIFLGFAESL